MIKYCISLLVLTFFFACKTTPPDIEQEQNFVKNTDIEFSKYSEKHGMKKAFMAFADSNAVLLKNRSNPIIGKEKIGESYTGMNDSLFTLTWHPLHATVSNSADLAYTFGTYTLRYHNDTLQTEGTYVTIWKKQPDGKWKWILDTGNEGLSE